MKLNKFNRYIISFIILLLIGGLTACEKLPTIQHHQVVPLQKQSPPKVLA